MEQSQGRAVTTSRAHGDHGQDKSPHSVHPWRKPCLGDAPWQEQPARGRQCPGLSLPSRIELRCDVGLAWWPVEMWAGAGRARGAQLRGADAAFGCWLRVHAEMSARG